MSFDKFYGGLELQCLSPQEVAELCFEAGAASRQGELDELKRANTKLEIQVLQVQQSCGGCDARDVMIAQLQKRIDEALEAFEDGSFNQCQEALKGG